MSDDYQPDLNTIGGRLEWARRRKGHASPRKAAAANGWNENTYKAHEQGLRGSEGLKVETAKKYARGFGVNANWLITGFGEPIANSETQRKWDSMTETQRKLFLRLVEASEGDPLVQSMPDEEIPLDELPAHFKGDKKSAPTEIELARRARRPRR